MVNFKIYNPTDWTKIKYNIHILPNILRSKANQAMEFSQLIIACEMFFFKNPAENEIGKLVPGLGLSSPPHFVYDFSRKNFSAYTLLSDQISISGFLYFFRY